LALKNRLNTRDRLCNLGLISSTENICLFCLNNTETIDHLLLLCPKVYNLWCDLICWWGCDWVLPGSFLQLFSSNVSLACGKAQKKVWRIVFYTAVWTIWMERNSIIFKQVQIDWSNTKYLIFIRMGLWLKALDYDFPYQGPQVLLASDGLKFKKSLQKTYPKLNWFSLAGSLKWNVDGAAL